MSEPRGHQRAPLFHYLDKIEYLVKFFFEGGEFNIHALYSEKKIHWCAFYDIISNNHYLIIAIRKILIILQLFPMNLSHRPA